MLIPELVILTPLVPVKTLITSAWLQSLPMLVGPTHQPSLQPLAALVLGITLTSWLSFTASLLANARDSIISFAWELTRCLMAKSVTAGIAKPSRIASIARVIISSTRVNPYCCFIMRNPDYVLCIIVSCYACFKLARDVRRFSAAEWSEVEGLKGSLLLPSTFSHGPGG